ncbi:MAG: DUF1549 domain-containing protein, partial [Planctomycetia bacterium]
TARRIGVARAVRRRPGTLAPLGLLAWVAWCGIVAGAPADSKEGIDFFELKIRPVLVRSCLECHSAEAGLAEGNLLLDSRDGVRKGGSRGPAVDQKDPSASLLLTAIRHADPRFQMPPDGADPLPPAVVADFEKWIAMGAPDPRDVATKPVPRFDLEQARREHWSFQPLRSPDVPRPADPLWNDSPIDGFIRAAQEREGLVPAAPADPLTWLRRVHLDLVGLPPTPAEQQAFVVDSSAAARERVVDELLARPQYGERWGRHWLDVARYAETNGYEHDALRPHSWRYRDWVIDALNRDLPYDRFVVHQLAGDEIEGSDSASQIATSFLCIGPVDHVSNDGRKAQLDLYDDIVGTTASAFLGLTLQCARCHDHKFEPLLQADYYRMLAAFEPLKLEAGENQSGPVRSVGTREDLEQMRLANERLDTEREPVARDLDTLKAGLVERAAKADPLPPKGLSDAKVTAEVIEALRLSPTERAKKFRGLLDREKAKIDVSVRAVATPDETKRLDELEARVAAIEARRPEPVLASIFSEHSKPPTTRILLRGEHATPGEEVAFAPPAVLRAGDPPACTPTDVTAGRRRALAEFIVGDMAALAARVMANRVWQYHFGKGLMRDANDFGLIGGVPSHPELLEWLAADLVRGGWKLKRLHRMIVLSRTYGLSAVPADPAADPDDTAYTAWPVHRLEAEPIRDSILSASGSLNLKMGGPSVHPPFEQKIVGNSAHNNWKVSEPGEAARRSVYVFAKRAIPYPDLAILGLPESSVSCGCRAVATTSVQALLMMNGTFVTQQASAMAARLRGEAGADTRDQVRLAFSLTLCRPPRDDELATAMAFVTREGSPGSGAADGLAALCAVLFNTNEFVYAN